MDIKCPTKRNLLTRRFIHLLSILLILAIGFPVSASITQPEDLNQTPFILASLTYDWFEAVDFAPVTSIQIQIFDAPGGTLLWMENWRTDTSGDVHISNMEHPVDLIPGTYIVMDDGTNIKEFELEVVTFDVFDPVNDILSGTAPPDPVGRVVRVEVRNEGSAAAIFVTADQVTGAWSIDLSGGFDVMEDMWAYAKVEDVEGDITEANPVPDPYFTISPHSEWFDGNNWPQGATVDITVASKTECTTSAESEDFFFNGSFPAGCDLVYSDMVTFTDGSTTRTHIVQNLDVTNLDLLGNTVAGIADPGAEVHVWPHAAGVVITVTATTPGVWLADFSGSYDIVAGEYGRAAIYDAEGNSTAEDWGVPSPYMVVFPEWDWYDGVDWPDGPTVYITVTGKPVCTTSGISSASFFNGSFPDGCDLEIGDTVTFTDGVTTRTHIVQNLSITEVDIVNDTVSGTADAGASVDVWPDETGQVLQVTAGPSGAWQADFNATYDLFEGAEGRAAIWDAQGNGTSVGWVYPNPYLIVFPEVEWLDGINWPDGATVDISVTDKPECTLQKESLDYFFNGNFPVGCDLEIGDEVIFTNGLTTRTHIVQNLDITGVDIDTDLVSGLADIGAVVHVWVWDEGAPVEVTVLDGTWEVDFGLQGIDLQEGTGIRSEIRDAQGNATMVDYWIPNPRFTVFPEWEWFDGVDWPNGATVDISVAGKPVCTTSQVSSDFFFNGGFPEGCDIMVGDVVTFTDGHTLRTHTVRELAVSGVDKPGDSVAGTSTAGAEVYVWPHDGGIELQVSADASGDWLADFSGQFDIEAGQAGRSEIRDAEGNATAVDWYAMYDLCLPVIFNP